MRRLFSIHNRSTRLLLAVTLLLLAGLLWRQYHNYRADTERQVRTHIQMTAGMAAAGLRDAVEAGDVAAAGKLARSMVDGHWVIFMKVYDNHQLLAAAGTPPPAGSDLAGKVMVTDAVIADGDNAYGRVQLGHILDDSDYQRQLLGYDLFGLALLFGGAGVMLAVALVALLIRDLRRLKDGVRRIASGEYGYQLPVEGDDELALTVAGFNAMSRSLEEAYRVTAERERALRLSEIRLAEAQHIASLGNWEWNYQSDRLFWSDEIYRIFGLPPRSVSANYEMLLGFVHADDRAMVRQAVDAAVELQRPFNIIHRVLRQDGDERWVRQRGEVFRDADGAPLRVVATVQDITEARRADAALEEKTRQIVNLLESTTDAYFALDRAWHVTYFNAEAERVLELPRAQAEQQVLWDIAPELASSFYKRFSRAMTAGEHQQFTGFYPPLGKWFETHLYPHADGMWVFFRDVTERRRNETALLESSGRNQAVLDNILDGIVTVGSDGLINGFNHAAERIFGYEAGEVLGKSVTLLMPEPYRSQHDMFVRRYLMTRDTEEDLGRIRELVGVRCSGEVFPLEIALSAAQREAKPLFIAVMRDLTERRAAEENMRLAAKMFDNSVEGILVTDAQSRILRVNRAFSAITGYTEEEIVGSTPALLKSGRHDEAFYQNLWQRIKEEGRWQGEIWNRRKNGEVYPEWLSINVLRDNEGQITHYVAIFSDITEKKEAEQRIYHLAYYDALTELPNRTMFYGRLLQAMAEARRSHRLVALLYIDLDRFKNINDTLGHFIGDELLKEAARRLTRSVRDCDTVARLGGDEFVIMLTDLHHENEVVHIAQKVLAVMAAPFQLEQHEVFVTTSIGISLCPLDSDVLDDLIKFADTAMYHAKEAGRNTYQFYRAEMNAAAFERLVLESSLRRALEREEFSLHYQPQNDLASGEVIGVEALLRWHHPDLGLVMPTQFIPVLEETGMIGAVGEWVLRTACRQVAAWQQAGIGRLRMAVNLSPRQFDQSNLVDLMRNILRETGADPAWLELEITEGCLMENAEESVATLRRLKAMGIGISVDDFGTGYSSLSYLKRFPIDTLKIDQSFVHDVNADGAIAGTIIAMGHSLNLRVLAEGVENCDQLKFLMRHGCDEVQGYLFSEPLPAQQVEGLLREGRRLDQCND